MEPLLATKLYIPPARPELVARPRLVERLNAGLHRKGGGRQADCCRLRLVSAPAGFGKTTLVREWVSGCQRPVAWLSLDEGDNDPVRFLAYLVAALRTVAPHTGAQVMGLLQSPQPPPAEMILTALLNDIAAIPGDFVLVLDDYHVIDADAVDRALAFLLEHLPPGMHLVIATRQDPDLPLARLRAQGQLTELRLADLRFTPAEAAEFLNRVMGLNLSAEDIAALETRTEGWIAGLQLAALALQGLALQDLGEQAPPVPPLLPMSDRRDAAAFIKSFTGGHHFVMDYLVEEVLQQQPAGVQDFLLRTSILDRMCGPLCDAVVGDPAVPGQQTLRTLEQANLFIVPLDDERRWYRYHHLFADLLRQRLLQGVLPAGEGRPGVPELHQRASAWYEEQGLEIDAFRHAVAAGDIERAARLLEGKGMPLHFRGAVAPVLHWLESLPKAALDARPSLWVMYASALSMTGRLADVEGKLQAAEAALHGAEPDAITRNLIGHIAAIRALLAAAYFQVDAIITQSRRALEYLDPGNLPVRTATIWKLGIAYQLQGDRAAASQAYAEAATISRATGNTVINMSATAGLANVQETENQLSQAAQTYQDVLQMAGDPPHLAAIEVHLGLARIYYEWNDLLAVEWHVGQITRQLWQVESTDRFTPYKIILARLALAGGDADGAASLLAQADQQARRHNYLHRIPEIVAAQVLVLLRQGDLPGAMRMVQAYPLPLSQARVYLAGGDPSAALAVLEPLRRQMDAKGWADERLKVMVLQALAHDAHSRLKDALSLLGEALALAEPGGLIRTFVDEGAPMADLLSKAAGRAMPAYSRKLLAVFEIEGLKRTGKPDLPAAQPLIEPLSPRELEILRLIAQGLSNREIGQRLFLSVNTVKGHNRVIFDKLQVQRRTEAVARARQLGLL